MEGDLGRRGVGMYDRMNSVGANEIIIETPEHNKSDSDIGFGQMVKVVSLYKARIADLEKDFRLRYVLIYKNSGRGGRRCLFSSPFTDYRNADYPKAHKRRT